MSAIVAHAVNDYRARLLHDWTFTGWTLETVLAVLGGCWVGKVRGTSLSHRSQMEVHR